eukprot:2635662-Prymnesium_polylepis.1
MVIIITFTSVVSHRRRRTASRVSAVAAGGDARGRARRVLCATPLASLALPARARLAWARPHVWSADPETDRPPAGAQIRTRTARTRRARRRERDTVVIPSFRHSVI